MRAKLALDHIQSQAHVPGACVVRTLQAAYCKSLGANGRNTAQKFRQPWLGQSDAGRIKCRQGVLGTPWLRTAHAVLDTLARAK